MNDPRRLLDIWIVETNTAYRAVPFETVANWLQQGRLLGEDRVRPANSKDWFRIDAVPALGPYMPRVEPERVEDQAEALEPIEPEIRWRSGGGDDEDDDPDMIPLIDITLVLLIFFMMTAAVSTGMFAPINTPAAEHQLTAIAEGSFWLGIDISPAGQPRYSLGRDDKELVAPGQDLKPALDKLRKDLEEVKGEVRLNLRADEKLPIEVVKDATLGLQQIESQVNELRNRAKLDRIKLKIAGEVRGPSQ